MTNGINDPVVTGEGERATYRGVVRDAATGEPLPGVRVRLEMLRINYHSGRIGGTSIAAAVIEDLDLYDLKSTLYRDSVTACESVEKIGATELYTTINNIYYERDGEMFIVPRKTVQTNERGVFQYENRTYSYIRPEGYEVSVQRLVFEKDGYLLEARGIRSDCSELVESLKQVRLRPAVVPPPDSL